MDPCSVLLDYVWELIEMALSAELDRKPEKEEETPTQKYRAKANTVEEIKKYKSRYNRHSL